MVILRPSGWAIEIEIKVTRADIKADLKKHKHNFTNEQSKFRQFYFAVPKTIADDPRIPERAGILAIHEANGAVSGCEALRPAKLNPIAQKFTDAQIRKLLELGCMRIWTLKTHIANFMNQKRPPRRLSKQTTTDGRGKA